MSLLSYLQKELLNLPRGRRECCEATEVCVHTTSWIIVQEFLILRHTHLSEMHRHPFVVMNHGVRNVQGERHVYCVCVCACTKHPQSRSSAAWRPTFPTHLMFGSLKEACNAAKAAATTGTGRAVEYTNARPRVSKYCFMRVVHATNPPCE